MMKRSLLDVDGTISMTNPPPHWTYYVRPIWLGLLIGVIVGVVGMAICYLTVTDARDVHVSIQGIDGTNGDIGFPVVPFNVFIVSIVWGFFGGLMVALWKRSIRST